MALGPAGVHTVQHLRPVLGLGAAGAGVKSHDDVVVVILAGKQGGQTGFLHLFHQRVIARFQLFQQLGIIGLLPHFAQRV